MEKDLVVVAVLLSIGELMGRFGKLMKSKTVWGAIFAAGGWLVAQPSVGVVEVVQALGGILSAVGVRDAISQLPGGHR